MIKIKVAISSTGDDLESEVDLRFGRCPYYLIVNVENKEIKNFKAVENPGVKQGGGAGIAAAEFVAGQKIDAVVTVNIGPNAFNVLNALDIKIYKAQGVIKEVIDKLTKSRLEVLEAPNNPMSFGRDIQMNRGGF